MIVECSGCHLRYDVTGRPPGTQARCRCGTVFVLPPPPAEAQAMAEVQAIAADTAVAAARTLIANKIDASADAKLVDADIAALSGKLN